MYKIFTFIVRLIIYSVVFMLLNNPNFIFINKIITVLLSYSILVIPFFYIFRKIGIFKGIATLIFAYIFFYQITSGFLLSYHTISLITIISAITFDFIETIKNVVFEREWIESQVEQTYEQESIERSEDERRILEAFSSTKMDDSDLGLEEGNLEENDFLQREEQMNSEQWEWVDWVNPANITASWNYVYNFDLYKELVKSTRTSV